MTNLIRRSLAALLALTLFLPFQARAVDDLWDFSTTASSNTNISGVSMAEGMLPGLVNDGIRALIAQLKKGVYNKGSDIASATTTNICATGTSHQAHVTGTTTITSFGTAAAGCWRIITFDGALTLTHNATSLIIPGATNITTVAGDVVGVISEGSGNWRVVFLSRVPYLGVANTFTAAQSITTATTGALLNLQSTEAGAVGGPNVDFYRNSATPAANDVLGGFTFNGEDSGGATTEYANVTAVIVDQTDTSEDGRLRFVTTAAGASAARFNIEAGMYGVGATGGDKGAGTVNALGVYVNGHGTIAQVVRDTDATYTTATTDMPIDNSIPQITEGDEILSVAITPVNASSTIRVRFRAYVGASAAGLGGCALFVDATAAALDAVPFSVAGTTSFAHPTLEHSESAASTTLRTYRIRCGPDVGTPVSVRINGDASARVFGGVGKATLEVEEILPQ